MRVGRDFLLLAGIIGACGWCWTAHGEGAPRIITGDGAGLPTVKRFLLSGASDAAFLAYTPSFDGGVRVAAGDVNGDGVPDMITGPGPGTTAGGHIKVFSGHDLAQLNDIDAFPGFAGGVFVASGDVNNDGRGDIIVGADAGGGPQVKVYSGDGLGTLASFFAYGPTFTGGVRVAAGDINGDGKADIITGAGTGSGGHVKVFDGLTNAELRSFLPYGAGYTGGSYVAGGDVNGDGLADLIVGADSATPHVKVFSGADSSELYSFFAYDPSFAGGVRVAAGDLNGDGKADIITGAGPGAGPQVKVFSGADLSLIGSFFADSPTYTGGIFVAAAVPEPSTMALVGMAIWSLVVGRRQYRSCKR
jgi:fibronectin-binding autotransporter adhesin